MKPKKNKEMAVKASSRSISATEALVVHLICGLGLAVAFWVAHNLHSINLTTHPSHTLRLICVIECPIVILLYSRYRKDRERCSYLKAVGRGLLGLPADCACSFCFWFIMDGLATHICIAMDPVDYMICIPAHGVIIGAWFGAFPMPLDWERPWQEWPICVSYGAIAGYLVAMVASFGFILVRQHVKGD
ncbi:uncharacterized protein LOC18781784 isoform X2 [Prunus persica]|uniref:uncharacterized protein LOC18781784 isoform X2 n=1 Tax=Prunus persica TaxID=3760 RepID=UPI0009AB9EF2|nr:uncharacterized protein LOC18781784 isoform X2 [Prunus persica]